MYNAMHDIYGVSDYDWLQLFQPFQSTPISNAIKKKNGPPLVFTKGLQSTA